LYAVTCLGIFLPAAIADAFEGIIMWGAGLPRDVLFGDITRIVGLALPPEIILISPSGAGGLQRSPVHLKLQFRAFGGAAIDPDSVVVIYVKQPPVDITPRIKPFITAAGIDIAQWEVPPGQHEFWVELKDTDGHIGGLDFSFQISP
jgi:hypothetical protein